MCIEGELYDVAQFVSKHPGEGIRNVYLSSYRHKDTTREFDQFHNDNEPHETLAKARSLGVDPVSGIRHLGRNPFSDKRRLPRFFRGAASASDAEAQLSASDDAGPCVAYAAAADGHAVSLAVKREPLRHLRLVRDADSLLWRCDALGDDAPAGDFDSLEKFIDAILKHLPQAS
jgi:hypothetical protein